MSVAKGATAELGPVSGLELAETSSAMDVESTLDDELLIEGVSRMRMDDQLRMPPPSSPVAKAAVSTSEPPKHPPIREEDVIGCTHFPDFDHPDWIAWFDYLET